jgi:hypothetical protein
MSHAFLPERILRQDDARLVVAAQRVLTPYTFEELDARRDAGISATPV